jgi:hypothetical protein
MRTGESSLTPAWLGFDPTYGVLSPSALAEELSEMVASGFAIGNNQEQTTLNRRKTNETTVFYP